VQPHQISLLGTGEPELDPGSVFVRTPLDEHAWIDFAAGWMRGCDTLLGEIVEALPWQQGRRWMYDRMVDDPRLTCFQPQSVPTRPALLAAARAALSARYGVHVGRPAFNYYRDGRDSVAPHSDRELRELDDTLVAILTLGARRPFLVKAKTGGPSRDLAPGSGDLLVMGGRTQMDWEHAVPKVKYSGPRVSVSWRWSARRRSSRGTA
jgi:alkylated DNA repair dioxygenase AlkB